MDIAVTMAPLRVNSQKEIGLPARRAMPEHDHVGAGADGGDIAAEVGAERERPPQHLRVRAGPASSAPVGLTIGAMVATYGMLSMMPRHTTETPQDQHRRQQRVAAGRLGGQPGQLADDAGLHQRADHDEQAGEEQQRVPLDAGQVVATARARRSRSACRRPAAPPPTARCGAPSERRTRRRPATRTTPRLDEQPRIADGLALVQRHDVGDPLGVDVRTSRGTARGSSATKTPAMTTTIGARWTRKSLNDQAGPAGDDDVRAGRRSRSPCRRCWTRSPRRSGTAPG